MAQDPRRIHSTPTGKLPQNETQAGADASTAAPPTAIRVLAAVIEREGRYLICQRPAHKRHGGLWEFPGGKLEPGESDAQAANRELQEELGVQVTDVGPERFLAHDDGSPFHIAFVPVKIVGQPACLEHAALAWSSPRELARYDLAPSDRRFVEEVLGRAQRSPEPVTLWRVVNIVTLVAVLAVNGAAGSGALSGESIGLIANRYRSDFLPANYVFGIWSLIYLWLTVFTIYQTLPGAGPRAAVERVGGWWLITSALNMAWVTAFSFSRFGLAMMVMLALLVSLVMLVVRLQPLTDGTHRALRWCVAHPFALYLAWISVAIIANTFQYAHVVQWSGLGIAESTWSAVMMGVATLLGTLMVATRGLWLFPLVVAWALWGIGARYTDVAVLRVTATTLVAIGLLAGAAAWAWRRSRRLHTTGAMSGAATR